MPTVTNLQPADPRAAYLAYKEEIDDALHRVLSGGWYILGEEVERFEGEFAYYLGAASSVGVGSGTAALSLALRACGIGGGDVVATVSHTAVATVAAVELVGATPLLVDIDPITFTMDPERLEAALKIYGPRVKAVIPVHLYGHPADMPAIMDIAGRYGLSVVEDCAQSHGASIRGRKTGTWGRVAAFSFYPTKNLGALGDGGAVAVNDAELTADLRLLRQYGWRERYVSEIQGDNSRLDELQAAVLRVKLRHLDEDNERRRVVARAYDSALDEADISTPVVRGEVEHAYHQYVVRCGRRDDLKDFLGKNGVGSAILYPLPVHLQPAYLNRVLLGPGGLPSTEQVCRDLLCLPIHPQLSAEQVKTVTDLVLEREASLAK